VDPIGLADAGLALGAFTGIVVTSGAQDRRDGCGPHFGGDGFHGCPHPVPNGFEGSQTSATGGTRGEMVGPERGDHLVEVARGDPVEMRRQLLVSQVVVGHWVCSSSCGCGEIGSQRS
jgi:hypothetical protein